MGNKIGNVLLIEDLLKEIESYIKSFSKIEDLPAISVKSIVADEKDEIRSNNNYSSLKNYENMKGIYAIYTGNDDLAYIGKGGTGNGKDHDLADRIGQELRLYHKKTNSSGTLSINIFRYKEKNSTSKTRPFLVREDEVLYQSNSLRYKKYIMKWKIRVMSFKKTDDIPINIIEAVLIRLKKPKYNLDL